MPKRCLLPGIPVVGMLLVALVTVDSPETGSDSAEDGLQLRLNHGTSACAIKL